MSYPIDITIKSVDDIFPALKTQNIFPINIFFPFFLPEIRMMNHKLRIQISKFGALNLKGSLNDL
jgi:hypothetical protein